MILVTGATGRIGKNLVKALLNRGEQIRILVYGDEKIDFENVEVIYGDISDKEAVKKAVQNCDVIYHLAAIVDYLAPKNVMYKVNVLGAKNIAEFGKDKKIIYLSSTSVYGYNPKDNPITENTQCKPSNLYGKTKYFAEKYILDANGIIIRSADVFGRGFKEGYNTIFSMLQEQKLPLIDGGNSFVHWIHINDLIQALLLAKDRAKPKEIYLVAGKEVKALKELLKIACKYLNVPFPTKTVSRSAAKLFAKYSVFKSRFGGGKPALIPDYVNKLTSNRTYDIKKAENELGFKPQVDYETAEKEMIEDFLKDQQNNVAVKQSNNQS